MKDLPVLPVDLRLELGFSASSGITPFSASGDFIETLSFRRCCSQLGIPCSKPVALPLRDLGSSFGPIGLGPGDRIAFVSLGGGPLLPRLRFRIGNCFVGFRKSECIGVRLRFFVSLRLGQGLGVGFCQRLGIGRFFSLGFGLEPGHFGFQRFGLGLGLGGLVGESLFRCFLLFNRLGIGSLRAAHQSDGQNDDRDPAKISNRFS